MGNSVSHRASWKKPRGNAHRTPRIERRTIAARRMEIEPKYSRRRPSPGTCPLEEDQNTDNISTWTSYTLSTIVEGVRQGQPGRSHRVFVPISEDARPSKDPLKALSSDPGAGRYGPAPGAGGLLPCPAPPENPVAGQNNGRERPGPRSRPGDDRRSYPHPLHPAISETNRSRARVPPRPSASQC